MGNVIKMNKLYNLLDYLFGDKNVTVEEPKVTTESIRDKITEWRREEAAHNKRHEIRNAQIREGLKLFPIGIPASAMEIELAYDQPTWSMLHVLEELVQTDDSGWEYANIDGCILYQRTA